MNDVVLTINSQIGQRAADAVTGLEEKVKASMRAVREGNWMETNEDALFRAGVGGALLSVGRDSLEGERLISSINALRRFSAFLTAAQAGVSADLSSVIRDDEEKPLPLMQWWRETK